MNGEIMRKQLLVRFFIGFSIKNQIFKSRKCCQIGITLRSGWRTFRSGLTNKQDPADKIVQVEELERSTLLSF